VHRRRQIAIRSNSPIRNSSTSAAPPTGNLAFGTGAHQCAGMALARLEGAIAISRYLARFSGLCAERRAGAWRPGAVSRFLERGRAL